MVALLTLVGDAPSPSPPSDAHPTSPTSPNSLNTITHGTRKSRTLRKITPARCYCELALHNVTFAYPSRPTAPVLTDVSLFTSQRNDVHRRIFRLRQVYGGTAAAEDVRTTRGNDLDEQDVRFLDEEWMRANVAGVGQQGASRVVILDEKSVYENVAMGLLEHSDREDVTRAEVEDVCRAALVHEFVRDLPDGYDTLLGGGTGVGLSGGQKQRLSIARARLRNLILGASQLFYFYRFHSCFSAYKRESLRGKVKNEPSWRYSLSFFFRRTEVLPPEGQRRTQKTYLRTLTMHVLCTPINRFQIHLKTS